MSSQREHDSPRPSPLPSDQSNAGQHPQQMEANDRDAGTDPNGQGSRGV